MAREGITRTQVFEAADAISKSGSAPTVAAIRAKLGTGSFTTITAHLRDWKTQATAADSDDEMEVPEEVTSALERAAALVWKSARDHFEAELAAIRKEADAKVTAARDELQTALDEIERLEANADNIEDMQEEITSHLAEIRRLNTTLAERAAELKAANRQITEQSALLLNLTRSVTPPKTTRKKKDEPKPVPVDDKTQPPEI